MERPLEIGEQRKKTREQRNVRNGPLGTPGPYVGWLKKHFHRLESYARVASAMGLQYWSYLGFVGERGLWKWHSGVLVATSRLSSKTFSRRTTKRKISPDSDRPPGRSPRWPDPGKRRPRLVSRFRSRLFSVALFNEQSVFLLCSTHPRTIPHFVLRPPMFL